MQDALGKDRPGMVYQQMDALKMTFGDCQFSVVLDKGTLDALMPDDSEDVRRKTDKLFNVCKTHFIYFPVIFKQEMHLQ
jgi:hypothetical protein